MASFHIYEIPLCDVVSSLIFLKYIFPRGQSSFLLAKLMDSFACKNQQQLAILNLTTLSWKQFPCLPFLGLLLVRICDVCKKLHVCKNATPISQNILLTMEFFPSNFSHDNFFFANEKNLGQASSVGWTIATAAVTTACMCSCTKATSTACCRNYG